MMKKNFPGLVIVGLLFLSQAATASAEIRYIYGSGRCSNPGCGGGGTIEFLQNDSDTLRLVGAWVDYAEQKDMSVSGGSGVSAVLVSTQPIADGENFGTGQAKISIIVNPNAEPGIRTINIGNERDSFRIRVVRNGKVTSVDVPSPTDFFREVTLTLHGTNIGNAAASVTNVTGSSAPTAEVTESTNQRAVIKLTFPSLTSQVTADIKLYDRDCGICKSLSSGTGSSARYFYRGLIEPTNRTNVTITGPVAVKEIQPLGQATSGSNFSFKILLNRAAGTNNVVSWQISPSTSFREAPGSGTSYDPNTPLNRFRFPDGATEAILTVAVSQLPNGCAETCTGTIQTRVVRTDVTEPPYYKQVNMTFVSPRR